MIHTLAFPQQSFSLHKSALLSVGGTTQGREYQKIRFIGDILEGGWEELVAKAEPGVQVREGGSVRACPLCQSGATTHNLPQLLSGDPGQGHLV